MSTFLIGNLFLGLSLLLTALGHVLLKAVMNRLGVGDTSWLDLARLLDPATLWQLAVIGAMILGAFLLWLLSLTRLDLSYAYPVASGSVLLVALLSALILGEAVTLKTWLGTALILLGVIVLTPAR